MLTLEQMIAQRLGEQQLELLRAQAIIQQLEQEAAKRAADQQEADNGSNQG